MIYIEMSRDEDHGGGTWGFTNCVWAPTKKKQGASWPFWTKVSEVVEGDIVIHLRGISPNAYFLGYSIASTNGFETTRRPPYPGEWDFAESFFRADLKGFTEFHEPINLSDVFASRALQLNAYFERNRNQNNAKANIFFVRQSGRLQCLNGAYLSDVDDALLIALFGDGSKVVAPSDKRVVVSVETGFQIASVRVRLGQSRFSAEIKKLYRNTCCFPDCEIEDPRFLVGSHIARWSDNEELRGQLANGLCLCLMHDKAFELGLFTLDEQYRIFVNTKERRSRSEIFQQILKYHGKKIRLSRVHPSHEALLEHWIRVDIEPFSES